MGRKANSASTQHKALVIDPKGEDLDQTSRLLSEAGLRVVSLSRYDAAAPVFSMLEPDVVILAALRSDDLQGLRTAQRLRSLCGGVVPVLFLTDTLDPAVRQRCLEEGKGLDVLQKPADGPELVAKVSALLGFRDAIANANRLELEARGPTLHDPITGVYNRQFLLAMIAQEARRGERYGGTFSVLAMTLSGFGNLEQRLGEAAARKLLVYATMVLTQTMREADMVARVSEDSFAVLLPGTPFEQLPRLTERLRDRFEQARFQLEGRPVKASIALGAVSFPDVVGSAPQLLDAAFSDLRRAQSVGRAQRRTRVTP